MFKLNSSFSHSLLAACTMAMLAACGTTVSKVDSQGNTDTPVFKTVAQAGRSDGIYVNLENLGKIRAGMDKKQLFELIGPPHYSEGLFNVREWDYVLKFRQPDGQPDKVCQYKILFDDRMIARSFYFKPANCMEPAVVEAPKVRKVSLAADATFAFDSAQLQAAGRAKLAQLASEVDETGVTAIEIVGHTDRFGNAGHNAALSLARAGAVRDFLVQEGVAGSLISIDGRGAAEPLVECPGAKSPAIIDCLEPNRRTTVTIRSR
ncbi:Outer membrane protein P5 precursor [compost metagenome]